MSRPFRSFTAKTALRDRQHILLGCSHFSVTGWSQIGDIADFDRFAVIEATGFHQSIFDFGLLASIGGDTLA